MTAKKTTAKRTKPIMVRVTIEVYENLKRGEQIIGIKPAVQAAQSVSADSMRFAIPPASGTAADPSNPGKTAAKPTKETLK